MTHTFDRFAAAITEAVASVFVNSGMNTQGFLRIWGNARLDTALIVLTQMAITNRVM